MTGLSWTITQRRLRKQSDREVIMSCAHERWERIDGAEDSCPVCLRAEVERLRAALLEVQQWDARNGVMPSFVAGMVNSAIATQ